MSSEGAKGGGGAEGGGIPLTKKKGASVGISAKGKGMSTVAREIDAYKELLLDKSQKRLLTSQEVGEFQCYLNRLQRRLADKRARFEKRARILKMLLQKRPGDTKFSDEMHSIFQQTSILNKDIMLFNETVRDFQSSAAFKNIHQHVLQNYEKVGNDESAVYIKKEPAPEDEEMEISFEDLLRQEKKMGSLQKTTSNPLPEGS